MAPPSGGEDDRTVPRDHPHLQESHVRRLQDPLGSGQLSVVDFTTFQLFHFKASFYGKIMQLVFVSNVQ